MTTTTKIRRNLLFLTLVFNLISLSTIAQVKPKAKSDVPALVMEDTAAPTDENYDVSKLQTKPEFPGGPAAFNNYIVSRLRVPEVEDNVTVKIHVSFIIEKDGSMADIRVLNNPGYGLGNEAVRVLKTMQTKWSPGRQDGEAVRCQYNLPLTVNIKP